MEYSHSKRQFQVKNVEVYRFNYVVSNRVGWYWELNVEHKENRYNLLEMLAQYLIGMFEDITKQCIALLCKLGDDITEDLTWGCVAG